MLVDYMLSPGMLANRFLLGAAFQDARETLLEKVRAIDMEEATRLPDLWNNRQGPPPYDKLQCPVLCIIGADDAPFVENSHFLLRELPAACKAVVVTIPEVGVQPFLLPACCRFFPCCRRCCCCCCGESGK